MIEGLAKPRVQKVHQSLKARVANPPKNLKPKAANPNPDDDDDYADEPNQTTNNQIKVHQCIQ
jgi:hypothetical protein